MNPFVKAQPPGWNGDFLKIYSEDEKGKGLTILSYYGKEIVLSEMIGIKPNTTPIINKNHIVWLSSHGKMTSDGLIIKRSEPVETKSYPESLKPTSINQLEAGDHNLPQRT